MIKIKSIEKKDVPRAIQFAIEGMHFNWYLKNKILLNLYGRYFWYLEKNKATHMLAAYLDDKFVGVLMAEMYGEAPRYQVRHERAFVRFVDFVKDRFFKGGADVYDDATQAQLADYKKTHGLMGRFVSLRLILWFKGRASGVGCWQH